MKSKTEKDVTEKDENSINFTNHFPTAYPQTNNLKIMQIFKKVFLFGSLLFISKENRCNVEGLGDLKFNFLLIRHEKTQNKNRSKSSVLKSIPIINLCNLPISLTNKI